MKRLRRIFSTPALAAAAALGLAAVSASGCGYTTRSLVPDRYRTVSVDIVDNQTRRHDLQWEVTRAVVEEVQSRTHLRVVPSDSGPDLSLEAALIAVDEDVSSRRSFQRIRESDVFLTAQVTVRERASGAVIAGPEKVTEREAFVPVIGENVRTARQEAVRALAEKIARTLESGW